MSALSVMSSCQHNQKQYTFSLLVFEIVDVNVPTSNLTHTKWIDSLWLLSLGRSPNSNCRLHRCSTRSVADRSSKSEMADPLFVWNDVFNYYLSLCNLSDVEFTKKQSFVKMSPIDDVRMNTSQSQANNHSNLFDFSDHKINRFQY